MTLSNEQTSRGRRAATLEDANGAPAPTSAAAVGDAGEPGSRRAARERERHAAELLAQGQQHPSGVVDFGSHEFVTGRDADGEFDQNSTADIWEALVRRAEMTGPTPVATPESSAPDVPAAPTPPAERRSGRRAAAAPAKQDLVKQDSVAEVVSPVAGGFAAPVAYAPSAAGALPAMAPVTDELVERVRDAVVLGRERGARASTNAGAHAAPVPEAAPQVASPPLTRRQLRAQKAAETVDGMPASWFNGSQDAGLVSADAAAPSRAQPVDESAPAESAPIEAAASDSEPIAAAPIPAVPFAAVPSEAAPSEAAPSEAAPIPPAFGGVSARRSVLDRATASDASVAAGAAPISAGYADFEDTATVAMAAVDRAVMQAKAPVTAPVDLSRVRPMSGVSPVGDDRLLFSAPIAPAVAEPLAAHPAADPEPTFVAPPATPQLRPRRSAPPVSDNEGATSAAAAPVFVPAVEDEERTNLAGFEAMITRSRNGQGDGAARSASSSAWPMAATADDQHAGFSGLLSRDVAVVHGSQNALIMPTDPQPDLTKAVTGTGELFVTGSLNLSRALATTGATKEHYDALDIDRLFEASQDEPAANVAPVRASRAVSGGPSDQSVSPRRTRSSALPTVLAIVAGVMAVGVITLLVGSWIFKLWS